MPSNVVPRGDRYGARVTRKVGGEPKQEWLGTFDTPELAQAAADRARKRKRKPRRERPPSLEDVERLVACARARERHDVARFILVAMWTGMRLFEVAAIEPVHVLDGRIYVPNGKGGKERTVVIFEPGMVALHDTPWPWPTSGPILRNQAGHPFRRQAINRVWSGEKGRPGIRDDAGLPRAVFHDLRKAHATWLLDRGVSDLDVAYQLGHVDHLGRPDAELVRRIYGFPDGRKALGRVAEAWS